jgi:hypothetical protein
MNNLSSYVRGHIQAQHRSCALTHSGVIRYTKSETNCTFSSLLPSICNEHLYFLFGLQDSYIESHDHADGHHAIQVYSLQAASPHRHIIECNSKLFSKNDVILPVSSLFQGSSPLVNLEKEAKVSALSTPIRFTFKSKDYTLSQPIVKFLRVLVNETTTVRTSYKTVDVGLHRNSLREQKASGDSGSNLFSTPADPSTCTNISVINSINNLIAFLKYYFPEDKMATFLVDKSALNDDKHFVDVYTYSRLKNIYNLTQQTEIKLALKPIADAMLAVAQAANNSSGILLNIFRALLMEYKYEEDIYNSFVPNVAYISGVGIVATKDIYDRAFLHVKSATKPLIWTDFQLLKVYTALSDEKQNTVSLSIGGDAIPCKQTMQFVEYKAAKRTCVSTSESVPHFPGLEKKVEDSVEEHNKQATCLPAITWNTAS